METTKTINQKECYSKLIICFKVQASFCHQKAHFYGYGLSNYQKITFLCMSYQLTWLCFWALEQDPNYSINAGILLRSHCLVTVCFCLDGNVEWVFLMVYTNYSCVLCSAASSEIFNAPRNRWKESVESFGKLQTEFLMQLENEDTTIVQHILDR